MDFTTEYLCNNCPKKFKQKTNLVRHMKCHSDNQYECDQCSKFFLRKDSLKRHVLVHSTSRNSELETREKSFYLCPHCGKKITKENYAEN